MQNSDGEWLDTKTEESTLRRTDLIVKVSGSLEIPYKEATVIVELILDSIVRALGRGEKVEIRRFGSFGLRQKARPHCAQSKKRNTRRSPSKEDSLLQTEQGASGAC